MKENPDMNANSNERIDELLNGYIDDELPAEQMAEVEGLIDQDAKIAKRLRQFQKCRILVGSMPVAEAPASVLDGVKASLDGISLQDVQQTSKRYVLVRKVLAAAAMIALAAVLSAVISKFVPQNVPEKPVVRIVADSGFSGRLEIKTSALNAVDAFIKSAIDDNSLTATINPERRKGRRIYSIICSKKGLNSLLANLDNIWSKLDSTTLFVNTEVFGVQAVVDAVTIKQIAEIAGQDNLEKRIELAKDFAVLNNITEHVPDKEIRVAIESGKSDLTEQWRFLKPALTGPQKSAKKPAEQIQEKQDVRLTIILDW